MSARALARLAHLLRGGRWSDHRRRVAGLRQRLNEARTAVRKWKARATDAGARRRELLERLSAAERAVRGSRDQIGAARREAPTVAVARLMFPHRLRTLSARVNARSSDRYEETLLRASLPYRTAVDGGPDALNGVARRTVLDGLVWWIPRRMGEARFPYRAILQTREAAAGGIMLDLGASVGRMAIPRVVLGDVTAAYCAEPDPVTFACLARNVLDNGLRGLVLPDQTAIGDRNGTARLFRAGASGGNFRLVPDADVDANIVDVPCCTLDTWVDRLKIDLDAVTFIKVDVEGSERRVLAGASRVLSRPHVAWQMEVKPSGLRAAGDEPGELYADLQRTFTHFIDLNRRALGPRVRSIAELPEALRYIEPDGKTDVLLFSGAAHLA